MLTVFKPVQNSLQLIDSLSEKNIWVNLINPSEEEVKLVSEKLSIDEDFLNSALDEEERSYIDYDDGQIIIVLDMPFSMGSASPVIYHTIPFGIIATHDALVTVCLRKTDLIEDIIKAHASFFSEEKTNLVLKMLFDISSTYIYYLNQIDALTNEIEAQLHMTLKNEKIIRLLNLQKSLVYFSISLRSNEIVLEKLLRIYTKQVPDEESQITTAILQMGESEQEKLEDVITENRQAIEMCDIYSKILGGMMNAFSSVISNNLNIVMKFLASVTIILAIPTVVFSFFGQNVNLPMQQWTYPFASIAIIIGTLFAMMVGIYILSRKGMF